MPKKSKTVRRVCCVVCHQFVPVSECVESYADHVCRVCDEEMVDRDQELYERDVQDEIDRVWGYGK